MMKPLTANSRIFDLKTQQIASCLCASVWLSTVQAHAQQIEFADDFSENSIRYTARSFLEVPDSGTAEVIGENLILKARQGSFPEFGNIYVGTQEATDTLMVTAAFNPATSLPSGSVNENATIAVEQRIFNTIADGGLGDGSNTGDVQVRFDIRLSADGSSEHGYCLGEQTIDSFVPLNVFDGNSRNCSFFEGVTIQSDVEYTFGFSLDRSSGTLTLSLDDRQQVVTLPGTLYAAENPFTGFQLIHQAGPGEAEARIRSITTDSGTDTITSASSIGRYQGIDSSELRSALLIDERVQLSARATEEDDSGIQLRVAQPTDYIEALMEISSQTALGDRGRLYAELRADLYNDTADGGFNDREGDVSAFITFESDTGGLRRIEYCLSRSDDADNNERSGLLADGQNCVTVPIRLELDTPYRVSLDLDREQSTLSYRVNGFTHTQAITTDLFTARRKTAEIGTYPDNLSSVVITVDDLRTAADAISATEQAAGLAIPPPFPAALTDEAQAANSTLTAPVFDDQQALSFIDDFSTPTMLFGFWDGRDRGEVAVTRSSQGYVEFQVNSADPQQGNFAEFYVDGSTDLLEARVSISTQSDLPQDSEAQAAARIQGTFYNDIADGGSDGQLGDVFISLQIRVRGDGRRDADLYMERRAADGSRDTRLQLVADGENVFEGFAPETNTEYTMALELDRDNNVLTARIDNLVQEISLPGEVFTAARAEKQVQISHQGSSGKAVGRIHAIRTDKTTVDFLTDLPLIGPYRPAFDTALDGIEVSHEDGRVRLVTDSAITPGRGANLQARGVSDYLAATMLMSSETTATGEGRANIGIGGLFYNELADGGTNGATGSVFATISLSMKDTETGTSELFAEYCAFRSLDPDFSESQELIGGDTENCPRFTMPAMTDIGYDMSILLDRERQVLAFTLNDETHEFAIATPIFDPHSRFNGARARATEGSRAVGYADNLSYSVDAVPLSMSSNQLAELLIDDPTQSSSGGGGCSISTEGRDPLLPTLGAALVFLWLRRKSRALSIKYVAMTR